MGLRSETSQQDQLLRIQFAQNEMPYLDMLQNLTLITAGYTVKLNLQLIA